MGVLMRWFLDDLFEPWMLEDVVASAPGDYYVDMMRAWYVAEAVVRHRGRTTVLVEVTVTGEEGKLLAAGTFTFFCVDPRRMERNSPADEVKNEE